MRDYIKKSIKKFRKAVKDDMFEDWIHKGDGWLQVNYDDIESFLQKELEGLLEAIKERMPKKVPYCGVDMITDNTIKGHNECLDQVTQILNEELNQ